MQPIQYMDLISRMIEEARQSPLPLAGEGGSYNLFYLRTDGNYINVGFESVIPGIVWKVERQILKPKSLTELAAGHQDIIVGQLHLGIPTDNGPYVTLFTTTDLERVFSTKVSSTGLPGKLQNLPHLNDRRLEEAVPELLRQYFGR